MQMNSGKEFDTGDTSPFTVQLLSWAAAVSPSGRVCFLSLVSCFTVSDNGGGEQSCAKAAIYLSIPVFDPLKKFKVKGTRTRVQTEQNTVRLQLMLFYCWITCWLSSWLNDCMTSYLNY